MTDELWYTQQAETVLTKLKSTEDGLSQSQITKRQKEHGKNALPRKKKEGWSVVLFRQFTSPLIVVLAIAAMLSGLLKEWVDFGVIGAAVLLNTLIGFVQEYKATQALEQLRSLVQPHAIVRREQKEIQVLAEEIVPGDILLLRAGDRIVADARILSAVELVVDESALTGESLPIEKEEGVLMPGSALAERKNMVFAGSNIAAGRGLAVVVATGVRTELGKIAHLVDVTDEGETPLQSELKRLARWLSAAVLVIIVFIFFTGILAGYEVFEMFETSVALAVAAIPEGLIITVTIVLAISMQRILKRKALVRRLVAGETLGSVSIICTDKTGTITEGVMQVSQIVPASGPVKIEDIETSSAAKDVLRILEASMLCNNATVSEENGVRKTEVNGSPTEAALMRAGLQTGISYKELYKAYPRFDERPFDSSKKYMVSLNNWTSGERVVLLNGAPERVLAHVSRYFDGEKIKKLSPAAQEQLSVLSSSLTERGLRLLAVAMKPVQKSVETLEGEVFEDFVFLGFIGLQDPLRKEAKQQIALAAGAGIRTVVVTGDHPRTARAIGAQAGLATSADRVVRGEDLDAWSDDELRKRVEGIDIFARVEPRHKIRIVNAWQARGEVVAMTGDGVNDAPALKAADIGVALGSGTEVAKQASDIVLLDNNLSTITSAIEQGRIIFDNIRKSTLYLLLSSFTEVILIAGALIFKLPLPLLPAQILWINLFQDSFPSIALTMEAGESDVMQRPPRARKEPVLNSQMLFFIFIIGLLTDVVLLLLFVWYLKTTGDVGKAQTVMFAAVGIDSLLYVFAIRNLRRSIFRTNPFSNLWLVGGVLIGFGLMALGMLHPFFQRIFEVSPLGLSDWGLLLMMGMMKLVCVEISKEFFILRERSSRAHSS